MKLTPMQQKVLDELRKPGVVAHYMPYMGRFGGDYWFLSSTHLTCSRQINKLIELGLVKRVSKKTDIFGQHVTAVAVVQEGSPTQKGKKRASKRRN